jgi:hypothetical protein
MQRFPYLWQLFEGAWWKAIVIAAYSGLAAVQRLAADRRDRNGPQKHRHTHVGR